MAESYAAAARLLQNIYTSQFVWIFKIIVLASTVVVAPFIDDTLDFYALDIESVYV